MELIDLCRRNAKLEYFDLARGRRYTCEELCSGYENVPAGRKRLACLYLDGSIDAVAAIWGFLSRGHAIALFRDALRPDLKESLEHAYFPAFIHDERRTEVTGYNRLDLADDRSCFVREADGRGDYPIQVRVDVLLSTSGTTASPKLVKLSQHNLLENARSILEYLPITPDDVTPLNLPIDYSYGLSLLTTNSLAGGCVVTSVKQMIDRRFWDDFRAHRFSSLAGTPDFYDLLDKLGFWDWKLPSLRYLTQAGGKLSPSLVSRFAEYGDSRGVPFFVMYGQTEATARMSYLRSDLARHHPDSIGQPVAGGRFRLDAATNELCYSGPNVYGGYVTDWRGLARYDQPAELRTGDLAHVDENGLYYIDGRIKRIVKIRGARVNLDEIEQHLARTFTGTRFLCTSRGDNQLVVGTIGTPLSEPELCDYLRRLVGIEAAAIEAILLASVPTTANGKVDYGELLGRSA